MSITLEEFENSEIIELSGKSKRMKYAKMILEFLEKESRETPNKIYAMKEILAEIKIPKTTMSYQIFAKLNKQGKIIKKGQYIKYNGNPADDIGTPADVE